MFNNEELTDIKRALIIALNSSEHVSMQLFFERLEEINKKIDHKLIQEN